MKKYIYIAIVSLFAFAACDKDVQVQETELPEGMCRFLDRFI